MGSPSPFRRRRKGKPRVFSLAATGAWGTGLRSGPLLRLQQAGQSKKADDTGGGSSKRRTGNGKTPPFPETARVVAVNTFFYTLGRQYPAPSCRKQAKLAPDRASRFRPVKLLPSGTPHRLPVGAPLLLRWYGRLLYGRAVDNLEMRLPRGPARPGRRLTGFKDLPYVILASCIQYLAERDARPVKIFIHNKSLVGLNEDVFGSSIRSATEAVLPRCV